MIYDRHGDIVSYVEYDDTTGLTTFGSVQDCEPIIENNKRLRDMNDGYSPSREIRRIASIPLKLFERWLQDDGLTYQDYYCQMDRRERAAYRARKYMSSDYRDLRTS